MRIKHKPTLQDIAQHARVSTTTVSRVINNAASVDPRTRARVLQVISQLGYKSAISQSQFQERTHPSTSFPTGSIALLITDILNPFFSEIVRGVEEEAGVNHLAMQLINTGENPEVEKACLARMEGQVVNGLIACASRLAEADLVALQKRNQLPMVLINRRINHPGISCVTINFEEAAARAAQHLVNLGHTRIGYLAGRADSESSIARRKGISTVLSTAGLTLSDACCPASFPNIEGGFQAMSSLLSLPKTERPTAIIAYNDLLAIGALKAARVHHVNVPGEFSVVGFDGIMMAAHSAPPLTTIDQPKYQMGKLAMQQLRQMIDGLLPSGSYIQLDSPLVVRESTAPYTADQ